MTKLFRDLLTAIITLMAIASLPAAAQDLIIYPAAGQSAEQQEKDRYECHVWAAQQTSYDPTRASGPASTPPPPAQEAPQGGLLRGGARGAAVGAVGGAIAGDAGKGAAIGAATGALIGGFRRRDQQRRQQQEQQDYAQAQSQQVAAHEQQRTSYNRAMSACLQGRGYTVN